MMISINSSAMIENSSGRFVIEASTADIRPGAPPKEIAVRDEYNRDKCDLFHLRRTERSDGEVTGWVYYSARAELTVLND